MATTSFTITNSTQAPMTIGLEPEATEWEIPVDEEICIISNACENSIAINVSIADGKAHMQVWPNQSTYKIYYKGEDLFG
jgi:hypothetical protein